MNVLVHRGDGDAQTRGNLTVGAADANLLQDLSLARAQTTDAAFGTWWTARPNSIGRRSESGHRQPPDGADHLRHRHGLRNESVGSRALAGRPDPCIDARADHRNTELRPPFDQLPCSDHSVSAGSHVDVHQDHVHWRFGHDRVNARDGAHLPRDVDVGLAFQSSLQAKPEHGMIVDDSDADRRPALTCPSDVPLSSTRPLAPTPPYPRLPV